MRILSEQDRQLLKQLLNDGKLLEPKVRWVFSDYSFLAQIETTGPEGTEDDYADARYWVREVTPTNTGNPTEALTFQTISGDFDELNLYITATNVYETGHDLEEGSIVRVFVEFSPDAETIARYVFTRTLSIEDIIWFGGNFNALGSQRTEGNAALDTTNNTWLCRYYPFENEGLGILQQMANPNKTIEFEGELYATGYFVKDWIFDFDAQSIEFNFIYFAKLNSSTGRWEDVGDSEANLGLQVSNYCYVFDNEIWIAGNQNGSNSAVWTFDGSTYTEKSGGKELLQAFILYEWNNSLYAGGFGDVFTVPYNAAGLVKWTGTDWSQVGSGIYSFDNLQSGSVYSLIEHNNELVIGGFFYYVDSNVAGGLIRWDGTQYKRIWVRDDSGTTISGVTGLTTLYAGVSALESFNDNLYFGGGGIYPLLGKWDGVTLKALDTIPFVFPGGGNTPSTVITDMAVWTDPRDNQEKILVTSNCTYARHYPIGSNLNRVARFDAVSEAYEKLSEPNDTDYGFNDTCTDLEYYSGKLYACGRMTLSGNQTLNYISRYETSLGRWIPVGTLGDKAHSMCIADVNGNDRLIIAGEFLTVNGAQGKGLALHAGTAMQTIGDQTLAGGAAKVMDCCVDPTNTQKIYICGDFDKALGQAGNLGVARIYNNGSWNIDTINGVSLVDNDSEDEPIVNCCCVDSTGSYFYVGGRFTEIGGRSAKNVARMNISTGVWESLSNGAEGEVIDIAEYDSEIWISYAGLYVDSTSYSPYIGRWDTANWISNALGGITPAEAPQVLEVFNNNLYVGMKAESQFFGSYGERDRLYFYDGATWEIVGDSSGLQASGVLNDAIHAVEYCNTGQGDMLHVGGEFTYAGDIGALKNEPHSNCFAIMKDDSFAPILGGLGLKLMKSEIFGFNNSATTVTIINDPVLGENTPIFSGSFSCANDTYAEGIGRYSSVNGWLPVGRGIGNWDTSGSVRYGGVYSTFKASNGYFYIGGNFNLLLNPIAEGIEESVTTSNIGYWDGTQFQPMVDSTKGIGWIGYPDAIVEFPLDNQSDEQPFITAIHSNGTNVDYWDHEAETWNTLGLDTRLWTFTYSAVVFDGVLLIAGERTYTPDFQTDACIWKLDYENDEWLADDPPATGNPFWPYALHKANSLCVADHDGLGEKIYVCGSNTLNDLDFYGEVNNAVWYKETIDGEWLPLGELGEIQGEPLNITSVRFAGEAYDRIVVTALHTVGGIESELATYNHANPIGHRWVSHANTSNDLAFPLGSAGIENMTRLLVYGNFGVFKGTLDTPEPFIGFNVLEWNPTSFFEYIRNKGANSWVNAVED